MEKILKLTAKLWAVTISVFLCSHASAQGTAFSYQGQLDENGLPANGSYDFTFALYDAATNGVVLRGPVTNSAIVISNGVFTTAIDFGSGVFDGGKRWLGIAVSPHGSNTFTRLEPPQALNPTPYAIYSQNASAILGVVPTSKLQGSIPASSITGSLRSEQLPSGALTNGEAGVVLSGQFSGTHLGDGGD